MPILHAIVLGIVQGLSEFLPISSSGHLLIIPSLLGWDDPGAAFTAVIQLGTEAAVLIYFRNDLWNILTTWLRSLSDPSLRDDINARMGWYLIVGTILAAMWLLVMMAGLTDAPPVSQRRLRLLLLLGPMVFLTVGLGGLAFGDAFLAYPMAYAKPLILAIELAMILTIAVTLGLLVAGPPERESGS